MESVFCHQPDYESKSSYVGLCRSPSPSSSTPSVNFTPISLFSTPASSQESQFSTILPQTLEEDYPIEEDPAPTLNSVNKTPMLLCQPCVEEESSTDSQIIGNIVSFLSNKTKNGGPDSYINKVTKNAVLTACLFTQSTGLDKIQQRLSINKATFYKFMSNNDNKCNIQSNNLQLPKHNKYIVKTLKLQVKVIDLFCHSEESSSIDSNACKVIMVTPDSPHPQRVWRVKTGKEQYDLFKQSDIVDEFR